MAKRRSKPPVLPPFKVTLSRLKSGEEAIPRPPKNNGQRTKLGGLPDWIQSDETPLCSSCQNKMSFVAQIDSIEHITMNNPFAFDRNEKSAVGWMFSDVGMIYVFYCFHCSVPASLLQYY
jgi:hypothetical protein